MVAGGIAFAAACVLAHASLPRRAGLCAADVLPLHHCEPWPAASARCGCSQKQLAAKNCGAVVLGADRAGACTSTVCRAANSKDSARTGSDAGSGYLAVDGNT